MVYIYNPSWLDKLNQILSSGVVHFGLGVGFFHNLLVVNCVKFTHTFFSSYFYFPQFVWCASVYSSTTESMEESFEPCNQLI